MNSKTLCKGIITVIFTVMMIIGVLVVMPAGAIIDVMEDEAEISESSVLPMEMVTSVDDYYIYGKILLSGYGVDGYKLNDTEGLLYVDNSGTCSIYHVSIPAGADPDMHPSNPNNTGPMAPRTFTLVGSYYFAGDCGWSGGHHAEFYIDDNYIYYGPDNYGVGGVEKWAKNADGTFGAYMGTIIPASGFPDNNGETFAYDGDKDTFYTSTREREVYSFRVGVDTTWQYEFTHPNYGGGHHDGMEYVKGYLWISDMTSDYISQWEDTSTGWEELEVFSYTYGQPVEGMGFSPLGHFWITSGSELYEIGGERIPPQIVNIEDQCIFRGEAFDVFDLDDYVTDPSEVDHWGYSGNTDLTVSIDSDNNVTVTYPFPWIGSEIITFTAYNTTSVSIGSDDAEFTVYPIPVVNNIPDQRSPFEAFDLDDYLVGIDTGLVTWSASDPGDGWTVDIDSENVVTVTAPEDETEPKTITFTATTSSCAGDASDSDDATFTPTMPVPTLTPLGIITLVGLLSIVAAISIRKKKE